MSLIGVVCMCRDPGLDFKQRVRHSRKDRSLYMDVMLDYDRMTTLDCSVRLALVLQCLEREIRRTLGKYEFEDFDKESFISDLAEFLTRLVGESSDL